MVLLRFCRVLFRDCLGKLCIKFMFMLWVLFCFVWFSVKCVCLLLWICLSILRCVGWKFCILIEKWFMLVCIKLLKCVVLMVFGLVFMVILVLLVSVMCLVMLLSKWVMLLGLNKFGVLLLIKMVVIFWLLMDFVLVIRLFNRCVIYFFLGIMFFCVWELKL